MDEMNAGPADHPTDLPQAVTGLRPAELPLVTDH